MCYISMPLKNVLLKRHKKKNATDASTNVDTIHENSHANLPYCHDGRFWDVPKKIKFPKNMLLNHGWIAWLKGFTENRERADERTFNET